MDKANQHLKPNLFKPDPEEQEILLQVDEQDNVIGEVARSIAKYDETICIRLVVMILFRLNPETDELETLWQQRSHNKEFSPGVWKVAAAGHVEVGEDAVSTAARETEEELGISIRPVFYEKHLAETKPGTCRQWRYVYYHLLEDPHLPLLPDKFEVEQTAWIPLSGNKGKSYRDYLIEHKIAGDRYADKITREIAEEMHR